MVKFCEGKLCRNADYIFSGFLDSDVSLVLDFNKPPKYHKVQLQKSVSERVNTSNNPCYDYSKSLCKEMEFHRIVSEKLDCKIPIMYSGTFLDHIIKNLKDCNDNETKMALEMVNIGAHCMGTELCKSTMYYTKVISTDNFHLNPKMKIRLSFETNEVKHYNTYISYDLQSFISDVGGVLGLTLGISGISFIEYLLDLFELFVIN